MGRKKKAQAEPEPIAQPKAGDTITYTYSVGTGYGGYEDRSSTYLYVGELTVDGETKWIVRAFDTGALTLSTPKAAKVTPAGTIPRAELRQ